MAAVLAGAQSMTFRVASSIPVARAQQKCNSGYDGVGPVCWEQCPSGWVDEGALCREKGSIKTIAKKSYGRGAGYPLTCDPSVPVMDAGLCYVPCPAAYDGVGPVW